MKKLTKVIEYILVVFTLVMVLTTSSQVFTRYVLNHTIKWAEEAARFTFVWCTYLGAALVIKERGHTRIDFFVKKLLKNKMYAYDIFLNIILSLFLLLMVYYCIPVLKVALKDSTPALNIPYGLVTFAFPFSSLLMIVYLFIDSISLYKEGRQS